MSQLPQQSRLPISPASGASSTRISPSPAANEGHMHDSAMHLAARLAGKRKSSSRHVDSDAETDELESSRIEGDDGEEDQPARKRAKVLAEPSQAQTDLFMDRDQLHELVNRSDDNEEEGEDERGLVMVKPEDDGPKAPPTPSLTADDPDISREVFYSANEDDLDDDNLDMDAATDILVKPDPDDPNLLRRGSTSDGGSDAESDAGQANEQDGSQAEEDEWTQYEDEEGQVHRRLRNMVRIPFERGEDGFVSGSLVRLKFKNFLTYDAVEFFPGPHLNMIIGPNGTGKSTIACGIALGCGFHPKLLGRANALSAFAKQGSEGICFVEVEFKNRGGQPNLVIRREFTNQNDKSAFFMGDEPATAQVVHETIRDLGIQVDNLCSFLPQDKVAEFARMSPEQLLIETMKAAGHPKLPEWHKALVHDGRSFARAVEDLDENSRQLAKIDAKVAELEPEINRLREKKELQTRVAALSLCVPYIKYEGALAGVTKAKVVKRKQLENMQAIQTKMGPLRTLQAEIESRKLKAEKNIATTVERSKGLSTAVQAVPVKLDELIDKAEELQGQLLQLKTKERKRRDDIVAAKKAIATTEEVVNKPPPQIDIEPLMRQRKLCQEKIQDVKRAERETELSLANVKQRAGRLHDDLTRANIELQQYQNAGAKRRQKLAAWIPSCGYAMDWIDVNRNRFEKEVHFPTAVSVTVSDPGFAPSIEAALNHNQKTTFICQTQRDYDTLNELNDSREHRCRDRRGNTTSVRIGVYILTESELNNQEVRAPISHDQLIALGLEGWALDFCQAEQVVKAFLKMHCRLDEAAVGRNLLLDPAVERSGLSRYYVWDPDYTDAAGRPAPQGNQTAIQISKYGRRLPMSTTQTMAPAQSFVNPVNDNDVRLCEQTIGRLTQDRRDLEIEGAKLNAETPKRRAEIEKQNDKIRELDLRKQEAQRASRAYERAKVDLAQFQATLSRLERQPSANQQRSQLHKELFKNVKLRAKLVEQHAELRHKAASIVDKHIEANFAYLAARTNVESIATQAAQRDEKLTAATDAYNEAHERVNELTVTAKTVLGFYRKLKNEAEGRPEFLLHHDIVKEKHSLQEIERMLVTAETELSLLPDLDRGAAAKLKQSRLKQKELRAAVQDADKKHEKLSKRMRELKEDFEPSLHNLVRSVSEKFSDAMSKVKCAGEVLIRRNEDYEKWAIEIKVKFRDNEDLQILTAQRQSGGERSLSTIMYLMSLTDLARAPFSLVDEINQGMDQRAERAVHDQLVRTTNQADGGQYFLITPKLLTNLDYHQRMKVLVINNGEWLPDEEPDRPGMGQIADMLNFSQLKMGVKPERVGR